MKKGQGWARRVTKETLPSFSAHLRQATQEEANPIVSVEEKEKQTDSELFKGEPFKLPKRFTWPKSKQLSVKAKQQSNVQKSTSRRPSAIRLAKGELLWRKGLASSDVQRSSGNTNPTGCLRLTQAAKFNPKAIKQTTFFRNDLFGNFRWSAIKKSPFEEATKVPFQITLNGETLGVFELEMRHKPSGEAGQGNYTT